MKSSREPHPGNGNNTGRQDASRDEERDQKGRTELHRCVLGGNMGDVATLLLLGHDVNVTDFLKATPLFLSVIQNNKEMTKMLVARGADVNAADCRGRTALSVCANKGNVELVKFLIDADADINAADEDGWTPLHESVNKGRIETVKILLRAGANVNAKDILGRTPLHISARFGYKLTTKYLINAGASVNATGFQGRTALHESSMKGYADVVSLLLFHQASVDVQDVNLWTPLHEGSAGGHFDIVMSLLLFGATVVVKNKDGDTPLMLAKRANHTNVERALRRKEAYVETILHTPDEVTQGAIKESIKREAMRSPSDDSDYEYPATSVTQKPLDTEERENRSDYRDDSSSSEYEDVGCYQLVDTPAAGVHQGTQESTKTPSASLLYGTPTTVSSRKLAGSTDGKSQPSQDEDSMKGKSRDEPDYINFKTVEEDMQRLLRATHEPSVASEIQHSSTRTPPSTSTTPTTTQSKEPPASTEGRIKMSEEKETGRKSLDEPDYVNVMTMATLSQAASKEQTGAQCPIPASSTQSPKRAAPTRMLSRELAIRRKDKERESESPVEPDYVNVKTLAALKQSDC